MTIRTDLELAWHRSPRTATYAAPSTSLLVQDNHDSLSNLEDSEVGNLHPDLIDSAGKEDLGGGTEVSITSTLQDTQIMFDARTTPASTATVTTGDADGETLIDSGGTFVTDGVDRGYLVINFTDQSMATVLDVNGEGDLISTKLEGGADNQYDVSDDVKIYQVVEVVVSGGNIVAVDDIDAELPPILPSFGVMITRALASSATITETGVSGLTGAESTQLFAVGTPGENADAVWDEPEVDHRAAGSIGAKFHLIEQIMKNRLVTDPATGKIQLYDDADTLLLEAQVFEDAGGVSPYSGGPINRKDRLLAP